MKAALQGNIEAVKLLLKAGADVSIKNDGGHTASTLAEQIGQVNIAELLKGVGSKQS
jgi:ankyrin repeat protein